MYKFFKNLSCLLCLVVIFGGCRKAAFDAYYNPPANLAPPIYQTLQSRGNFTNFLALIDRSGYTALLSTGGYWTVFAPNDAAFQKYFTANSTSLDKIDTVTAGKIVRYSLVFNAFQTNHIADYQSPTGWVPNQAFKRRTAYYDGFLFGAGPGGANGVYVSKNRNFSYTFGDNNNKYIPYFYSTFMAQAGLSATDYNYFFPNSTYSGFNVAGASVVNKDIIAQNGVIDEVDQVTLPLPSVEQKLAANSQYSVFKSILDNVLASYTLDANYTRQYNNVTNKVSNVYVKYYSDNLNYALGNESFLKIQNDDAQQNGYTLFAPTDAATVPYIDNTLLEFYVPDPTQRTQANILKNVAALPSNILTDFINGHLFQSTVWPSRFASTTNAFNEPARFNVNTDVVESQFGSNGVFYGVNKVQQTNEFSTVYARAFLDPAYSMMLKLLNSATGVRSSVTNPGVKYTIFMLSDAQLQAIGYNYDNSNSYFTYLSNGVLQTNATPLSNLQRILTNSIIPTPNNDLNDLSGDGIFETFGHEYIRWHNNTVVTSGLVEQNKALTVIGSRDYSNGRIYYLSGGVLDNPVKSISAEILANTGTAAAPGPYYDFYTYLVSSNAYNAGGGAAGTGEILGVNLGVDYTVFIPTRAAMQQAVLDGYLPGTYTTNAVTGVKTFVSFNYNPTLPSDKVLVTQFIQYHIINGTTIVPDGKKPAPGVLNNTFPTFLKDQTGLAYTLVATNTPGATPGTGTLVIRDAKGRNANVLPQNSNPLLLPGQTSNYLVDYGVVHQIDNYFRSF